MRAERHIIDFQDIAPILLNFFDTYLRDLEPNYRNEMKRYCYQEIIAQILLTFSEDSQETQLRGVGLPNMAPFKHLPILSDANVYDKLVDLTRHISQQLYKRVVDECLVEPNTRFFFDSASYTYIVLVKQVG